MSEQQLIPARHGTATFVPAGQVIKIINTSGTQVIDTWAFALPNPEPKNAAADKKQEEKEAPAQAGAQKATPAKAKKKGGPDLPSQEDAEKATQQGLKEGEDQAAQDAKQKSTWSSYVPSIGWSSSKKDPSKETEQQKNSRTWASYFPSGQGFSNYIPKTATDTVSAFAASVSSFRLIPNFRYLTSVRSTNATPTRPTSSSFSNSLKPQWEQQVGVVTIISAQVTGTDNLLTQVWQHSPDLVTVDPCTPATRHGTRKQQTPPPWSS